MNPLIVISVLVAVGSNEASKVVHGKGFSITPVLGGFLLGAFLFVIEDVNPKLGNAFAVLILASSLLVNGQTLFTAVNPARLASKVKSGNPAATGGATGKGSSAAAGAGNNGGGGGR